MSSDGSRVGHATRERELGHSSRVPRGRFIAPFPYDMAILGTWGEFPGQTECII